MARRWRVSRNLQLSTSERLGDQHCSRQKEIRATKTLLSESESKVIKLHRFISLLALVSHILPSASPSCHGTGVQGVQTQTLSARRVPTANDPAQSLSCDHWISKFNVHVILSYSSQKALEEKFLDRKKVHPTAFSRCFGNPCSTLLKCQTVNLRQQVHSEQCD